MADEKKARRKRADKFRQKIEHIEAERESPADDTPDMKPGESPNEYVERRMWEISHKKRTPRSEPEVGD
jgi:hypothetical protein